MLSENISGSSSLRTYSAVIASHLRDTMGQLQSAALINASFLEPHLAKLQAEASFFGFPATARLARKTRTLLTSLNADSPASVEQRDLLLASLSIMLTLIDEPCNALLVNKVDALCSRMDDHASRTRGHSLERSVFQFGTVASLVEPPRVQVSAKHEDLDIYSNDVMDGMEKCSDEESWIVTQLASAAEDLAGRRSDIRPAHKLMSVLRGHRFFQHMDRVCIVGLMPQANQLVVVDSCIHDRLREQGIKNRMPKGYSCFVNPSGSLFQMKPGVLRIFADSQSVLESFAKGGRPAQRSIAYVAESGLRSGICLAIGRGETVQGYLFMNSFQANLFDHVMRDYAPLLSLFSLMGTVALDAAGFHAIDGTAKGIRAESLPAHSQIFSVPSFKAWVEERVVQQFAGRCTVTVDADEALRFLYLPRVIVAALTELALRLGIAKVGSNSNLHVAIDQEGEEVCIALAPSEAELNMTSTPWASEVVGEVATRYVNRPLTMMVENNKIVLRFPYEPVLASNADVLYSVAY